MSSFASANQLSRLLMDGLLGLQTQFSMLKTVSGQLWPYDHQDSCYHQASPSIWQPCVNRLADWNFACSLSVCCLHNCSQQILTWCSPMMPLRVKHLHPSMRSWTGGSSLSLGVRLWSLTSFTLCMGKHLTIVPVESVHWQMSWHKPEPIDGNVWPDQ